MDLYQPIVRGRLNGKKAYFLVDTGSDITCLNLSDTKRYDIKYKQALQRLVLTGINSQQGKHLIANHVDLELDEIPLTWRFKVLDIDKIAESIQWDTGIRINGIIGSDLMHKYQFVINYTLNEITFEENQILR